MDEARLVDLLHGTDGGPENRGRLGPGHGTGFLQSSLQSLSRHKVHDDVGGSVLLKQVQHSDNAGDAVGLDHLPGFLQEHLHSVLPGLYRRFIGIPG